MAAKHPRSGVGSQASPTLGRGRDISRARQVARDRGKVRGCAEFRKEAADAATPSTSPYLAFPLLRQAPAVRPQKFPRRARRAGLAGAEAPAPRQQPDRSRLRSGAAARAGAGHGRAPRGAAERAGRRPRLARPGPPQPQRAGPAGSPRGRRGTKFPKTRFPTCA